MVVARGVQGVLAHRNPRSRRRDRPPGRRRSADGPVRSSITRDTSLGPCTPPAFWRAIPRLEPGRKRGFLGCAGSGDGGDEGDRDRMPARRWRRGGRNVATARGADAARVEEMPTEIDSCRVHISLLWTMSRGPDTPSGRIGADRPGAPRTDHRPRQRRREAPRRSDRGTRPGAAASRSGQPMRPPSWSSGDGRRASRGHSGERGVRTRLVPSKPAEHVGSQSDPSSAARRNDATSSRSTVRRMGGSVESRTPR